VKRFVLWIGTNVDTFLGLILALAVGILGFADQIQDQDILNSATLLVLALVAQSMLRDRWRRDNTDIEGTLRLAREAFDSVSMVRVLHGTEVGQALAEARRHTDKWQFKGGTGTFIRAVTLPECMDFARRRKGTVDFQIEIIDPTSELLCGQYAGFRRSLSSDRDATGELWTMERTQKEAFATILAACWYQQRSSLLKIAIYLSSQVTTFRYDVSSSCVIITQEDPRIPALLIAENQIYYHRYSIELRYSREQSREVPIMKARDVPLADEPTVEQVRHLFAALDLPLPRSFGDREIRDILGKALKAPDLYAS
jgi:hypothetical protein